MHLKVE